MVRESITIDKIRPDGRQLDEIRPLASEVGLLPRVHGSGLFTGDKPKPCLLVR